MFGYLSPDKPYLYMKDDTLYKALYCGICKSIGEVCGQRARFTLTYDVAFLSALAHNILGKDVEIKKSRCVAHMIKRRPIAKPDEISKKLGAINVILAYYKLKDDVLDENKGNFKSALFKKGYKKAKKKYPKIDSIVKNCYSNLLKLEEDKSDSIDIVADCFSIMLQEISCEVFEDKSTENTKQLTYAVGKWIYLIDALDDYDKDIKNNNFNVFYNYYKSGDYSILIKEHYEDIIYIFNSIFMQITDNYKEIKSYFNTDLTSNILLRGIPKKTQSILDKGKKEDGQKIIWCVRR